jgi:hypothetical protein
VVDLISSRFFLFVFITFLLLTGCTPNTAVHPGEQLAKTYCGGCHAYAHPSLLPKSLWESKVIPQMAFRMGLDKSMLYTYRYDEARYINKVIPGSPMISREDFEKIRNFYLTHAPDSIFSDPPEIEGTSPLFESEEIAFPADMVTMIATDAVSRRLLVGDVKSKLYSFTPDMVLADSMTVASPPTAVTYLREKLFISAIGSLLPTDKPVGQIVSVQNGRAETILDSLQRPSDLQSGDLDGDGLEEIVVCEFGNFTGSLTIYAASGEGRFRRQSVISDPGARMAKITDWNRDGRPDIVALLAQGNERLVVLLNEGGMKFTSKTLTRVPPIYGSNYFQVIDINNDGLMDILFVNGDNADYTNIPKPYHGLRMLINDGKGNVNEAWSYPMFGAWEAATADFDNDGDMDIAAISMFPDLARNSDKCFLYFENKGFPVFTVHTVLGTENTSWMAMEPADVDSDGDQDIVLGSFSLLDLSSGKRNSRRPLLLLRNQGKRQSLLSAR